MAGPLIDPVIEIVRIDPQDDAALRGWYDALRASIDHDRPHASVETYPALVSSVCLPSPYSARILLAARERDVTLGTVDLRLPLQDNTHLVELEIHVRPERRREGIGRVLHDAADGIRRVEGRGTVGGEVHVVAGDEEPAGLAFAHALGFVSVHREDHLVLPLPADAVAMDALRRPTPDYEVVTWGDHCPDELRSAFCRMMTQMGRDVSAGGVDYEPPVIDDDRLRTQEERLGRSYHQIVAAARRPEDGEMAGYSMLLLAHGDLDALQEDTLVMPGHRGHGLGLQLKLATYDLLRRDHPQRRLLHTYTAPDNHAMYRTNLAFGYERVELMHEMQRGDRP